MDETLTKPKKKQRLTKKQHGFVKDYLKTGVGSLAVKKNYDVSNDNTARAMASENLANPNISNAIEDALSEDKLRMAHGELLNQKRLEYFVFPKAMKDDEIESKVNDAGVELIVIRDGDKGRYAFYATIDAQARKGALDMAYKLKGSYAPEKSVNVNIDIESNDRIQALADKLKQIAYGETPLQQREDTVEQRDEVIGSDGEDMRSV